MGIQSSQPSQLYEARYEPLKCIDQPKRQLFQMSLVKSSSRPDRGHYWMSYIGVWSHYPRPIVGEVVERIDHQWQRISEDIEWKDMIDDGSWN